MADQTTSTSTAPEVVVPDSQESQETQENPEVESEASAGAAPTKSVAKKAVAEVQKQLKKLKIKYNGKEEDVEFDPNDEDYMTRQFQLAKLGQTKAQEYASLEKEVFSFIDQLRKDPKKVLSDPNIGIDVKKLAAQILEEEIENSKKSPEQLEKEKLQAEIKALKDANEKKEEDFRQKELVRLQEQEFQKYDTLMTQALEGSDLPKSPYVVKKMADYMLLGLQADPKIDLTPQDVLPIVREEMQNDLKEMFKVMPDEVIEALVGKDVIGRIRKKSVAKAKTSMAPTINKAIAEGTSLKPDAPKGKSGSKKVSFRDFFGT